MAFATMGAWSEFCNLDQKRAFFPLMTFAIEVKKFNERQLALLSLIYVDFQARQLDAYKKQGNCPAEVKDRFDKALLQFKR
ncbi:MAG: hypothetical protein NW215_08345 [Hyphomicrobiales bacterium]|nr:hypothetical protein [Hyphomicrobiales bacterium]